MGIYRTVLTIIFLFSYTFIQPGIAESSTLTQAEATVEIQYDGQVGSGVIAITSDPSCCTNSVGSNAGTITFSTDTTLRALNTTATPTSSSSSSHFNTPPVFGTSRTQVINVTSIGQNMFPTATGSSHIMTDAMASHSLSQSTPSATPVAGLGSRREVTWFHIFFWATITEIILGLL
jgi:hypothetical protein